MLHIGDGAKSLDLECKARPPLGCSLFACTCYRVWRFLVSAAPVLLKYLPSFGISRVVQGDEEGLLVEFHMRDLNLLPWLFVSEELPFSQHWGAAESVQSGCGLAASAAVGGLGVLTHRLQEELAWPVFLPRWAHTFWEVHCYNPKTYNKTTITKALHTLFCMMQVWGVKAWLLKSVSSLVFLTVIQL